MHDDDDHDHNDDDDDGADDGFHLAFGYLTGGWVMKWGSLQSMVT